MVLAAMGKIPVFLQVSPPHGDLPVPQGAGRYFIAEK
jgi:hypothetical protein